MKSNLPTLSSRRMLLVALALWALTFVCYAPVFRAGFISYDDPSYVTANLVVRQGLTTDGIVWAFTTGHMANWHPLTWISHMADVSLFGMRPPWHHAVSLGFHGANVLLLALLLLRSTGKPWRSLVVAALFAVHPLHVESVAWIAERKDVLSTFLALLAAISWVSWVERKRTARYVAALALFALALLAKPMVLTLPFVLLLWDVWPLGRLSVLGVAGKAARGDMRTPRQVGLWPAVLEKAPFFALTAASAAITVFAQRRAGAVATDVDLPTSLRFANGVVSYARYVGKTFWPIDLTILYPHPGTWPVLFVAAAVLAFAAGCAGAVAIGRTRGYAATGWFLFVGVIVPVSGILQAGVQSMADRYMYLPLAGLLIVLVWGAADVLASRRWGMAAGTGLAAIAIVGLGVTTFRQTTVWKNSVTLFEHAVAVTGPNPFARSELANAYAAVGRNDDAVQQFQAAVAIAPGNSALQVNLGTALSHMKRFDEALATHERVLQLDPDNSMAHYNVAVLLRRRGLLAEAEAHALRAMQSDPAADQPHVLLGHLKLDRGLMAAAEGEFRTAMRLNPAEDGQAREGLAVLMAQSGRFEEALVLFEQVAAVAPERAEAHANLANVLADLGRLDRAIEQFEYAIRLDPGNPTTRLYYSEALARAHRTEEAAAQVREAARLDPLNPDLQRRINAAPQQPGTSVPGGEIQRK